MTNNDDTVRRWCRESILYMKRFLEANDIYDAITPFLTIGFYYGLVPVRIFCTKSGRKYLKATNVGLIPTVLQIILFFVCFIISCKKDESIIKVFIRSSAAVFGDLVEQTVAIGGVIAVFAISTLSRAKYIRSIEIVVGVDQKLAKLGTNLNYSTMLYRSYVTIVTVSGVGLFFLVGCYVLLTQASISPSITIYYTNVLPHFEFFVVILLMISESRLLWIRFNAVNEVSVRNTKRFLSFSCRSSFSKIDPDQLMHCGWG